VGVPLRFGEFDLDEDRRQVLRGAEPVPLEPKAYELLSLLVTRRPKALSKAQIRDVLWPATFVSDSTLASTVADLRSALGDDARQPRFIRTLHGFGYAFCGTVSADPAAEAPRVAAPRCVLVRNGRLYPLAEGENVLGREGDAASWFDSISVSRRHARIVVTEGKALLEDLASKNGTFLGDVRVRAPVPLEDGVEIRLGSLLVTFRWALAHPSTETQFG
jgi:DNA-binding winged helix-turn-helix (wHTH) protein